MPTTPAPGLHHPPPAGGARKPLSTSGRLLLYLYENATRIYVWDDEKDGQGFRLLPLFGMSDRLLHHWELIFLMAYRLDNLIPATVDTPTPHASPMTPAPRGWPKPRAWDCPPPISEGPRRHTEENFKAKGKTGVRGPKVSARARNRARLGGGLVRGRGRKKLTPPPTLDETKTVK